MGERILRLREKILYIMVNYLTHKRQSGMTIFFLASFGSLCSYCTYSMKTERPLDCTVPFLTELYNGTVLYSFIPVHGGAFVVVLERHNRFVRQG